MTDALPFSRPEPDPARPQREPLAVPRHRHRWDRSMHGGIDEPICIYRWRIGPGQWGECGAVRDEARSRRGRIARQSGNSQERDWCKRLGFRRVGHYGGPEDGIGTDGLFVGQAKSFAAGRFPGWMSDELAKLPRTEGRIPILGVLEKPGSGHRPRRLVVIEESDWIALHRGSEEPQP